MESYAPIRSVHWPATSFLTTCAGRSTRSLRFYAWFCPASRRRRFPASYARRHSFRSRWGRCWGVFALCWADGAQQLPAGILDTDCRSQSNLRRRVGFWFPYVRNKRWPRLMQRCALSAVCAPESTCSSGPPLPKARSEGSVFWQCCAAVGVQRRWADCSSCLHRRAAGGYACSGFSFCFIRP